MLLPSHKMSTITNRKKKKRRTKTNKEQNVTFSETLNGDDILEKINYSIIFWELPPTTCSWSFQVNRNFSRKQYVGHFCGCFRLLCADRIARWYSDTMRASWYTKDHTARTGPP